MNKEMLKTAHHLSQLLKKTREENEYLRKCIETKNPQGRDPRGDLL